MELKRVVVTGLGTINSLGHDLNETWENMRKGTSGADKITSFDASNFKTQFACEVKNYDPLRYFKKPEARKMDKFVQFALIASDEAVKDAGFNKEELNLDRAGVIWGSGIGGLQTFKDEIANYIDNQGIPKFNPFFIPKMIPDIASGHISIRNGFRGPNYGTVSACASSTHALIDAFNLIRLGKADVFISGGSEAAITEAGVGGFNAMRAISTRNDDPKTASRPFDAGRDGFVMGDGGAALILEEYEHAKKRGAKIYAEFVGGGLSGDAHHITAPHPEGRGAAMVMQSALEEAGLAPQDIDYINLHGTSTGLGDIAEPKAVLNVFGEHAYKLSISSTKSMHGHLLGGTGALEALASIMAMNTGEIPPTINHFELDPQIDEKLDFTFNKSKKREVRAVLSNTFGFGGHNASVIFKKMED
ncbi:MAG: beta-ketoacyl-[acyl-carrier-protein] synthase II [Bacteroidia bacterium]|nr:MAG: beta-ketoacyl-[acyl-carrier-protein] synthase II [Bacteroidia bacterium]